MIKDIKKKFSGLFNSNKKTTILVVIGMIGIVLIAFSGKSGDDKKTEQKSVKTDDTLAESQTQTYKNNITEELEEILEKVDGVGECSVFLSVEGTAEYIYAENLERSQEYSSNGSNENYQSEIVMVDDSGSDKALVKKIIHPTINGVMVVCKGGGNITVKERVIKAVSTALDMPYGKICVEGKI